MRFARMPTLTVNGRQVEVPQGSSVLDAVLRTGADLPGPALPGAVQDGVSVETDHLDVAGVEPLVAQQRRHQIGMGEGDFPRNVRHRAVARPRKRFRGSR